MPEDLTAYLVSIGVPSALIVAVGAAFLLYKRRWLWATWQRTNELRNNLDTMREATITDQAKRIMALEGRLNDLTIEMHQRNADATQRLAELEQRIAQQDEKIRTLTGQLQHQLDENIVLRNMIAKKDCTRKTRKAAVNAPDRTDTVA